MKNSVIYDVFLQESNIDGNKAEFDLSFNIDNSNKIFEEEYLKFIFTYNYFFFDTTDKVIATIFNSYMCALGYKEAVYLRELYKKAKLLNKNVYAELIAEFLLSYKNSLETKKYKKELGQEKAREYKGILYKVFSRESFQKNGQIFKDVVQFYKNIIRYVSQKEISIDYNQKIRILSKFSEEQRQENAYKKIFDFFIQENKLLSELIKYDYNIRLHINLYKNQILNNSENGYINEGSVCIFRYLEKSKNTDDDLIKGFINKYINICNELTSIAIKKQENSISIISNIEQIIQELNQIKKALISKIYKEKISECINKVLYVKRKILNDVEYINSHLAKHDFKCEIPTGEIETMRNQIIEDFARLYPYGRINFDEMIIHSIESYAEHPMLNLVTKIVIDDNELYHISKERTIDNLFKKYYDKEGLNFTKENSKKLRNILSKDYYEHMIEYTKTQFELKIGFLTSVIYDDFNTIKQNIDNSRLDGNSKNNNLYVEMITQIIGIEVNIYKLLNINNLKSESSIEKNLENLFEKYIEDDFCRNGIMNIYYMLYCKEGYQIRDKVMHGDLLNKVDYTKELIMIYICMIFINYIVRSEEKNTRGE